MDEKKTAADKLFDEFVSKIENGGVSITITLKTNESGGIMARFESTDDDPALLLWMLLRAIPEVICDITDDHTEESRRNILAALNNVCKAEILAARKDKTIS